MAKSSPTTASANKRQTPRGALLLAAVLVSLAFARCGGSLRYDDGGDAPPTVVVACEPSCFVFVNGVVVAIALDDVVVPMGVGTSRVSVKAPGYLTSRFDVTLGPGESALLELQLWPEQ